ncbi:hypothetical protein BCR34DRAFT_585557 [Clohesyomyces aquaticus]|uniref:Ketoreductase domain-containing protein n=1 Tax=Clohesyomyces aquaticus TaxID=1231657 RepID=A0A1Y1ZX31_9PLEO|nr:hypothetical protein BCR34DRAFT_585557 [Clohesyomyces aquaticus]
MADPQEKVVIVTGASRGIGLAISQRLLSSPNTHKLVLLARTHSALDALHYQYPDQVEVLAGDVSDIGFAPRAVEVAVERWGRVDAVVVNHGVLDPVAKVGESDVESWRRGFDVNFFSGVGLIQAALPFLRKSHGRIIFTSSGAATGAYTGWGAYGASKAAMNHLAMTLGVEEPDVITLSIRPGVVDTEMQRAIRDTHSAAMGADAEKFHGLKRDGGLLRPEQPGHVIAKLAVQEGVKREWSGRFLSWNDELLEGFQEE